MIILVLQLQGNLLTVPNDMKNRDWTNVKDSETKNNNYVTLFKVEAW